MFIVAFIRCLIFATERICFILGIINRTFLRLRRKNNIFYKAFTAKREYSKTYALGFDRKIKDLIKPIEGHTNPEWRLDEFESPKMHERKLCQLSDIDV